jgi:hypothetical protein
VELRTHPLYSVNGSVALDAHAIVGRAGEEPHCARELVLQNGRLERVGGEEVGEVSRGLVDEAGELASKGAFAEDVAELGGEPETDNLGG